MLFAGRPDHPVDLMRTLKSIMTHDLVKAVFSDIPAFERSARKTHKAAIEQAARDTRCAAAGWL